jgi:hypothetical protein
MQASQLYERAISGVLSSCALLYFAYADFEEQNMKYEKVHTIYQKYLDHQARHCALIDKENKTRKKNKKSLLLSSHRTFQKNLHQLVYV